ncbi:uncharacterized protein LOC128983217 [Macrosteles quadrilineatus]|uniref:uncharacterized protein LOC128983217 n=1 Tax=Macrosteles quadrilineatus TaxID=74068 RepID=UPI0023E1469D|nr:uncharacterized protein LOC128983217 [Macrosteles quadrilineatus]
MKYILVIILASMCELGIHSLNKDQHAKHKLPMDTTNFDELANSKTFIDKTLMIKEVFKSPHHTNLILAPRKFGKTSNMNMIKRFCEIEVDENGNSIDKTLASSYNLFKSKNLKIFRDEAFVKDHFSSYAVLHLDYSTLQNIDSYDQLMEMLIVLISKTYSEHKYLLNNESLWDGFEKGLFQSYVSAQENHKDHNTHILTSLKWLCEILHKHFGKKVLVLIDEFDAYVYSAIFNDSKGIDKIMKLMIEIDGYLLKPNDHITKVLLTGTLKIFREDMDEDIRTYHFLENHPFSPYYGVTRNDLDNVLSKLVGNCGEKYKLLNFIMSYYGNYKIYSEDDTVTEIFNMWPAINYAITGAQPVDYFVGEHLLPGFKKIFRAQQIKEELQALILGEARPVERFAAFKEDDIRTLNYITKSYICPPSGDKVFLRLLYSFGYLTQVKNDEGMLLEEFRVPNNETESELMRYTPV